MRAPAVPLRYKLMSLCAVGLLACGLAPAMSLADESVAGGFTPPEYENDAQGASPNSSNEPQQVSASQDAGASRVAPMLASGLFGSSAGIISSDVMLDSADPVVGSFTVDGLTYAINDGGVTLIAVSSGLQQVTGSQDADDSRVAPVLAPGQVAIPASVAYDGTTYPVIAVDPYAFYLSGATDVALPASVLSVDDRTFRSSDVERVEVDPANPNLTSFDGALYSADESRLLLIPEGRKGSVLLSCETEVVEASLFSHCSLVDSISVEEGGAAFSSWDGLLYSADGTTLLRVPAGATEITVHDGCTTIAAGALEGCAKLERINAPASVISISPDVFTSIPTVSLPAQSALQDESDGSTQAEGEAEVSPRRVVASSQGLEAPLALPDLGSTSASPSAEASCSAPQLTAMVALSSADDGVPEINLPSVEVMLPSEANVAPWCAIGFSQIKVRHNADPAVMADISSSQMANAFPTYKVTVCANGHTLTVKKEVWNSVLQATHTTLSVSTISGTGSVTDMATNWHTAVDHVNMDFYDRHYASNDNLFQYTNFSNGTKGYSLRGFSKTPNGTAVNAGSTNAAFKEAATLYALWRAHIYSIKYNANGGTGTMGNSSHTYDVAKSLSANAFTRAGYVFDGWATSASGTVAYSNQQSVKNLTATDGGTVNLYAQWSPTISADVPLEVTARIDKLGIEDQSPAQGYIESRCGEPLKVTDVSFTPLPGASELFGAGNESQVRLQALAGQGATWQPGGANASFSFPLGASATESDAGKLAALAMGAYGERVPISYRFDVPDALLPTLAEATTPVCQVAYTVALA